MEVPAGQVNFRGSLPGRSASNVLEPMLHPDLLQILLAFTKSIIGPYSIFQGKLS